MTVAVRTRPLVGKQVRLRGFRRTDLPSVIAWRRDPELRHGALWSDAAQKFHNVPHDLRLMLGRAVALGLRKVLLEVAADNPRAVEIYTRAGFQTEGVLRRQLARPDGFVDVIVMAFFLA